MHCFSQTFQVISVTGCFVWLLVFRWDVEYKKLLSYLSIFTWFTVLCYCTSFLNILRIPAFLAIFALFIGGFVYDFLYSDTSNSFCFWLSNYTKLLVKHINCIYSRLRPWCESIQFEIQRE